MRENPALIENDAEMMWILAIKRRRSNARIDPCARSIALTDTSHSR